jgi:hypothetical protein
LAHALALCFTWHGYVAMLTTFPSSSATRANMRFKRGPRRRRGAHSARPVQRGRLNYSLGY